MPDYTHAIEAFIFLVLAAGVVFHEVDKRRHAKKVAARRRLESAGGPGPEVDQK